MYALLLLLFNFSVYSQRFHNVSDTYSAHVVILLGLWEDKTLWQHQHLVTLGFTKCVII